MRRLPLAILVLILCLGCAQASPEPGSAGSASPGAGGSGRASAAAAPASTSTPAADEVAIAAALGRGFVVWESNRGGAWRLWRQDLDIGQDLDMEGGDAGEAKPLTPAEGGRAHCCAHISPNGRRLAYLSLPASQAGYPRSGASGELRLLPLTPVGESFEPALGRPLVEGARTYFEHRAAVWQDAGKIIHIDTEGRTARLDVESGAVDLLVTEKLDAHGWLLDPELSFATRGEPTFSPYDAERRTVDELANLGGCQPYFSGDGRLGVWVAGAGGPIRAMELESRRSWPILRKSDERLPADRRYLYFPMPSRDGRALAWAASADEHDHTRADYDVFIAETDPETLELVGQPLPVGVDPATARFPDVWLVPLALGNLRGEAPFTVQLEIPEESADEAAGEGPWTWDLGDGGRAEGPSVEHRYETAGRFDVTARRGGGEDPAAARTLRGRVLVRPQAPPRLLGADVRLSDRRVRLRFDEAVALDAAEISLQPGPEIAGRSSEGERVVVLELAEPLERPAELVLGGVRDRAEPPNVLEEATLRLEPPRWPLAPEELVFLWQSSRHPNRVTGPGGQAQTTLLEPKGPAFVDRHGAMVLRGGVFQGDVATMDRLFEGLRATNELTLEMLLTPESQATETPGVLFGFAAASRRNLVVSQVGDRLEMQLNTASTAGKGPPPSIELGSLEIGEARHLLVTYTPGLLRAYLDGELTAESDELRSGFFHWQRTYLRLGGEGPPAGGEKNALHRPWRGRLEGVAVHSRAFDPAEAEESYRRYAEILERRDAAPKVSISARLRSRSRTPTLEEIAPYRQALAVFAYEVLTVGGEDASPQIEIRPGETVRVVHRVLLAGEETAMAGLASGSEVELELEPFAAQPQLESLFLSNETGDGELYWSERLRP